MHCLLECPAMFPLALKCVAHWLTTVSCEALPDGELIYVHNPMEDTSSLN